jgi:hypothetical protein
VCISYSYRLGWPAENTPDSLKRTRTPELYGISSRSSSLPILLENAKFALEDLDDLNSQPQSENLSIGELSDLLQARIESLERLNTCLECPAESDSDEEEAKAYTDVQDRPAHQYFAELIAIRFPHAGAQLVATLGLSNWNRYNHVQQQRNMAQKESEHVTNGKAKSEFHDSGLGSAPSIAADEYAATVVSSRAETSHRRLPLLPKIARNGERFQCSTCNRPVSIRNTRDWRYGLSPGHFCCRSKC